MAITRGQTLAALGLGVALGALLAEEGLREAIGKRAGKKPELEVMRRDSNAHVYSLSSDGLSYRVGEVSRSALQALLAQLQANPQLAHHAARKEGNLEPLLWGIENIGLQKLQAALHHGYRLLTVVQARGEKSPGVWIVVFSPRSREIVDWLTYRDGELDPSLLDWVVRRLSASPAP